MKQSLPFYFLIVLLFALTLSALRGSAQEPLVYMYWTNWGTGKIQRANLNGSNVQDIVTGVGHPISVALDLSAGKMYWTDRNTLDHSDPDGKGRIWRANLDGTNIENLGIRELFVKWQIALDPTEDKMYYGSSIDSRLPVDHDPRLERSNLDGTNIEVLHTGQNGQGLALDISRRKMYWTADVDKIYCSNLDGTNIEVLLTGLITPQYIALDFRGDKIYWTTWDSGKIQRANFDGSNLEDVIVGLGIPCGIALDSPNGKMYWASWSENKIQRANLDGSNVEDVVTGIGHVWSIALSIPQSPSAKLSFTIPSTVSIGEEFTAIINITNAVDLAGAQLSLHFNPAVLEVSDIHQGDLLSGAGVFFQVEHFNSVPGEISGIRLVHTTGVDGDGVLLKVDFKAKRTGVSTLQVRDLKLGNSTGVPIASEVVFGEVEVKARPDVTGDGQVNILDLVRIARHFGPASAAPAGLDVNSDGDIDILDMILVAQHLGK